MRRLIIALAVVGALTVPATASAAIGHDCRSVRLSYGDTASSVWANGVSCRRARRVIRTPRRYGWHCGMQRPQGSGGWVVCRHGDRQILSFLYSQS
jgi:hypothetical protein